MPTLSDEDRSVLLKLARSSIAAVLFKGRKAERPQSVSPALQELRGCFVTLHKKGELRGCIGNIEPVKSLACGVEENALHSAFKDPRFPPLTAHEFDEVEIEISVLSVPEPLSFEDGEDLKCQLKPGIHGVIISLGWLGATFLPQVWEQLPDKVTFLEHLCLKAGMRPNAWKKADIQVKVYEAEFFFEKDSGR